MTCPSAEELAALYDCVLPRSQAERVRAHLARCPRCANDIQVLERMLACPEAPGVRDQAWSARVAQATGRVRSGPYRKPRARPASPTIAGSPKPPVSPGK